MIMQNKPYGIRLLSSTIMMFFITTLLMMVGCNQKKSDDETTSNESDTAAAQSSAEEAMRALQGDSAMDLPEVTDEELQQFANVVQKIEVMQQEVNQKMIDVVEDEGMDVQEFNRIMQVQQNPQMQGSDSIDISDESMAKFNSASEKLQTIQGESQQEFMQAIEEEGLDFQRYRQIAMSVQQDRSLMQKLRSMSQEGQEESPAAAPTE